MKKFLWFLVGMAIIISIPILLFNREAPPKKATPQGVTSQSAIPKGETPQGATPQGVAPQGLTSTGAPSKEPLPKGIETRKDQGQKPGSVADLKIPAQNVIKP
jgi:hypothetical protein